MFKKKTQEEYLKFLKKGEDDESESHGEDGDDREAASASGSESSETGDGSLEEDHGRAESRSDGEEIEDLSEVDEERDGEYSEDEQGFMNEWNVAERTGINLDVYEFNSFNTEFNKKIYINSKNLNENLNKRTDQHITKKEINDMQTIAGKLDEIQYKNPLCFVVAYKYLHNEKKNFSDYVSIYTKIIKDKFKINIENEDFIRYIRFIKNIM
jgi:hypothetical protein